VYEKCISMKTLQYKPLYIFIKDLKHISPKLAQSTPTFCIGKKVGKNPRKI